jgi:hypothetical protein
MQAGTGKGGEVIQVNEAVGATMIVAGGAALWLAGHLWHAHDKARANIFWKGVIVLLVVMAGFGVGGGASAFFRIGLLFFSLGFVPMWLVLALITGIWLLVDLIKRHDWTRTPVLGFITAALIAVPAAGPALSAATSPHHQGPQVTSVTHRG